MDGILRGKTAWVVGGGSGLGAAAARELARLGAAVALSGRRLDRLEATARQVEAAGGFANCHPLDVEDPAAIEAVAAAIGKIDILVYSSGTNIPQRRLADISRDAWNTVIDVNLNGAFNAVHAVLPGMRERGDGLVVIISSWAGWRLEPVAGIAYSTTKRGLLALSEVINLEEGTNGIRSTCLCPAEVDTEVLNTRPVPPPAEARARMLQADDIGGIIGFLASAPPRMCVNEIVVSPTANNFYRPRP